MLRETNVSTAEKPDAFQILPEIRFAHAAMSEKPGFSKLGCFA